MVAVFTIFGPYNEEKTKLVNKLESMDYPVFIDSKHKEDQSWIDSKEEESFKSIIHDAVFFSISNNEAIICHSNPDILVEISDVFKNYDYSEIEFFLTSILQDRECKSDLPTLPKEILKLPDIQIEQNTDYSLRSQPLNTKMFYEVIKPYTDRPYTTVVHDFENKGHLKFFTNLFVCQSWGVCKQDIDFLKQCWIHFKMEGEFNLENLQKDTLLDIPPKVWRNTLENVLENQNKLNGFY